MCEVAPELKRLICGPPPSVPCEMMLTYSKSSLCCDQLFVYIAMTRMAMTSPSISLSSILYKKYAPLGREQCQSGVVKGMIWKNPEGRGPPPLLQQSGLTAKHPTVDRVHFTTAHHGRVMPTWIEICTF